MRLIYIAGPIRKGSIDANVAQADDTMLALMRAGFAVVNPMLSCYAGAAAKLTSIGGCWPHPLAHGGFRELGAEPWLTMDLEIVRRCDAVVRLPGESTGADGEVAHAKQLGIPVFSSVAECVSYFAGDAK